MTSRSRPNRPPQITSADAVTGLVEDIGRAMDDLLAVLTREADLVKAGRLAAATALAREKEEKATAYTRLMMIARDEVQTLAAFDPVAVETLKRRHDLFRAEVQINLAVLATARDVAEDLLRGVASEVGTPDEAGTYGPKGVPAPAMRASARGMAIDRNL